MAHHTSSSNHRHVPAKPSQARRAHKRRVRDEVLRRELELREHSPLREPEHLPRVVRKSRTPFWKILRRAVIVLLFIGAVQLGAASLTAREFDIRGFNITGCETTDIDKVHELSQPLVGQNWIRVDRKSVQQKIAAIPTVKQVRISRVLDWPPRLHVHVEERAPFARVGAGEQWWVVDRGGFAFRPANEEDSHLYAVTSPELTAALGKSLPLKKWQPVVEIAQALAPPTTEPGSEEAATQPKQEWSLRRIYFDEDGSAALRLTGGFHDETLVRLGGDHWQQKLERARQALSYFERTGRRAAVLNLVSYDMPQWTPRIEPKPSSEDSTQHGSTQDAQAESALHDEPADISSET